MNQLNFEASDLPRTIRRISWRTLTAYNDRLRFVAMAGAIFLLNACGTGTAPENDAKTEAVRPVQASVAQPDQDQAQQEVAHEAEFYAAGLTDALTSVESTRVQVFRNEDPLCCLTLADVTSMYRNDGHEVMVQDEGDVVRMFVTNTEASSKWRVQTLSFYRMQGGVRLGLMKSDGRKVGDMNGSGLINLNEYLRSRFPNLQVDVQEKERLERELEAGRAEAKRSQECVDYAMSAERMAKYDNWAPPACPPGR